VTTWDEACVAVFFSTLSFGCFGQRRRKLNDVGFLKGDNVFLKSTTHKTGKNRVLFPKDKSCRTI
jgi:hypothetical protein